VFGLSSKFTSVPIYATACLDAVMAAPFENPFPVFRRNLLPEFQGIEVLSVVWEIVSNNFP